MMHDRNPRRDEDRIGQGTRRPYHSPCLTVLGDVRDLTLGGSPGVGDSGADALIRQPAGFPSPAPPGGGEPPP